MGKEATGEPAESATVKAISLASGALLVLEGLVGQEEENPAPLQLAAGALSLWACFDRRKLVDVAVCKDSKCEALTDGLTPEEEKEEEEKYPGCGKAAKAER